MSWTFGYDLRRGDLDLDLLRKLALEWRDVAQYYYGDFYPLTPSSWDEASWMAWQFHRPDLGEGVIEAFRRAESADSSRIFRLQGLIPDMEYKVVNLDQHGQARLLTGVYLMEQGLQVHTASKPGAVVWVYKQQGKQ